MPVNTTTLQVWPSSGDENVQPEKSGPQIKDQCPEWKYRLEYLKKMDECRGLLTAGLASVRNKEEFGWVRLDPKTNEGIMQSYNM